MTLPTMKIDRRHFVAALMGGVALGPLASAFGSVGTSVAASLPAIDYDQGMGVTDATGLVTGFPLRQTGARQVFVDSVKGSARYNGLSPFPGFRLNGKGFDRQVGATGPGAPDTTYGPALSYAQALDQLHPAAQNGSGEGWQVFLAAGQRFLIDKNRTPWPYLRGYSIAFPFCLQSYDPRDPLNMRKHGRAGTAEQQARPELILGSGAWPMGTRGDAYAYDNWVFRGLTFINQTDRNETLGHVYATSNVLIENCLFDGVQLVLENTNPNAGFTTSKNVIVRRIASFGQYDVGGAHACGIYSSHTDITIEDSVFYHCGWKIGADRNIPVTQGGPDMFKHCLYLHGGKGTSATVRRVVMIDGSAAGASLRGSHLCHHNVIIDCPTPDFKGGGAASDTESPDGVLQRTYCHLVLGGADINDSLSRGQGFSASDGAEGSFYAYSLFVNNPKFGQVNNNWMQIQGNVPNQTSIVHIFGNRAFAYAPAGRSLLIGGAFPQTVKVTASDNVSQARSPVETADLYRALGMKDKGALVAAMMRNPMANWAYLLLDAAGRAFAFDFNRAPPASLLV